MLLNFDIKFIFILAIPVLKTTNRGRPSATSIEVLKQRSLEQPERHVCFDCSRSFQRKKSLDTHILTHSNMKPYSCQYPGCTKKFKQSGQLKTHTRLHTGEKPFQCTHPICFISFAHANRKCPRHPNHPLKRVKNTSNKNVPFSERLFIDSCKENKYSVLQCIQNMDNQNYDDKNTLNFTNLQNKVYYANHLHEVNYCKSQNDVSNFNPQNDETKMRLLSAVALVQLCENNVNEKENIITRI